MLIRILCAIIVAITSILHFRNEEEGIYTIIWFMALGLCWIVILTNWIGG